MHDFDTLEVKLEEASQNSLDEHFDNPSEKFRGEILSELKDTRMWKATLHNPDGKPFQTDIGTVMIDTETGELNLEAIDKTNHFSVGPEDLTVRTD
jgi:hypothetical protein